MVDSLCPWRTPQIVFYTLEKLGRGSEGGGVKVSVVKPLSAFVCGPRRGITSWIRLCGEDVASAPYAPGSYGCYYSCKDKEWASGLCGAIDWCGHCRLWFLGVGGR